MAKEPASIRYKNPGAMWGSALAIKWGAQKKAVTLSDGKGQGNNIAVFPTYVQGICAQLDLWRTSRNYKNKRFADAIAIWSGGNSVESYIAFVLKRVPGMTRNTVMNDAFWQSENGVEFLKAQAWHEAGKPYPAPDADWIEAQRRVFDEVLLLPVVAQTEPQLDAGVRGDPELRDVQTHLKAMKYNPGELDGAWGSMTAGAITGFISDRVLDLNPPTSFKQFKNARKKLKAEIDKAEAEQFTRKIFPARAGATPEDLAPKLADVDASIKSERVTFWGSIVGFFSAAAAGVTKYFGQAVEQLRPIKEFIYDVPWGVWVGGTVVIAGILFYASRKSGEAKIVATEAFKDGSRL